MPSTAVGFGASVETLLGERGGDSINLPAEMTLEQLVQEEDLAKNSVGKSDDDAIVVGLKCM